MVVSPRAAHPFRFPVVRGARIWRAIEKQLPLEAIANEISDAFQIARATAREHVVCFLAELERHSLIHREAES